MKFINPKTGLGVETQKPACAECGQDVDVLGLKFDIIHAKEQGRDVEIPDPPLCRACWREESGLK